MEKQRVDKLIREIKSQLEEVPDDGKEHSITVTVGGDNNGSIYVGRQTFVNVTTTTRQSAEDCLEDMPVDQLTDLKRQYERLLRDIWRGRTWWPVALMIGGSLAIGLWNLMAEPMPVWVFPMFVVVCCVPLARKLKGQGEADRLAEKYRALVRRIDEALMLKDAKR